VMTLGDEGEVNGLVLPAELKRALSDGRWSRLRSSPSLSDVFGSEAVRPRFYALQSIVATNRDWKAETDEVYLGHANSYQHPGNIDPRRSLIVAELGPDQLIALDYRDPTGPDVVFASDDVWSPWRRVAGSIAELLAKLA
jgi:hypothetical protein